MGRASRLGMKAQGQQKTRPNHRVGGPKASEIKGIDGLT